MNLSFLNDLNVTITPLAHLKDFTTFHLGGPCKAMIACTDARTLTEIVQRLRREKIDFLIMGFGSNILASDHGIDQIIVRYSSRQPIVKRTNNQITTDASTQLDDLILFSIQEGLDGLVPLSGIPGTVGGAITGNAGAYGIGISQNLVEISLLKPDGRIISVPPNEIHFDYRDSSIKHSKDIILSATFLLHAGKDPLSMKTSHDNIIATRQEKHGSWQVTPSAGSFFRNVLPSSKATRRESAGWFLEQAGAKTIQVGKAHCFEKHANIITHDEGATAQDVYALTQQMAALVKEKFQIELIREVRLLGNFTPTNPLDQKGYW